VSTEKDKETEMDQPMSTAAIFVPIHKALRVASCELLADFGRLGSEDRDEMARVLSALGSLLLAYENHLEHEERFVRPEAEKRLQGVGTAFDDHAKHTRQIAELRALASALAIGSDAHRAVSTRTLYLHLSTFIGESLVHMAEEEQVLAPLLDRAFSGAERMEIHARIQAAITPEERAYIGPFMMRALDPDEKQMLLRAMAQAAASEAQVMR
jgi:iron-sulfur cluster repair protein YtfE (RIC family)